MKSKLALVSTVILAICAPSLFAQDPFWINPGSGDWFVGTNWNTGTPPTPVTDGTIGNLANPGPGLIANINAGAAFANNLRLGLDPGTDGNVVIGTGGSLAVTNNANVGQNGSGSLTITDDGMLTATNIRAGLNLGSFGDIELSNPFGVMLSTGNTTIGFDGTGIMNITGGGFAHTMGDGYIGRDATGIGIVSVDGTGAAAGLPSEWTIDGNLHVGFNGTGDLFISNGGVVDPFNMFIGQNAGSFGFVSVDGSNAFTQSTLTVANNLFIGGNGAGPGGSGELDITNGGTVNVGNALVVWGSPTNSLPSNGLLAIDSTYNLTVGGTTFFEGGTLKFLDNLVNFTNTPNPVVLGTLTGPVGMYVDTNGESNIVGPDTNGFPQISALLTGPGGLTVFDGGTLFLTNNNTYTGDTNVNDAALFIDGSVAGNVFLNNPGVSFLGGFFNGVPNIGGDLNNFGGIVSPGTIFAFGGGVGDPATFVIGGNWNDFGGTYIAEVGSINPFIGQGFSDLVVTGGATTIFPGGTIIVPRLDHFEPAPTALDPTSRTTVILTGGGRFGEFDTLIPVNWPGLIQPIQLTDNPLTLDIGYKLNPFTSVPGLCDNEFHVAEALDLATTTLPINTITFLGFIPVANLPHTFQLIAPDELASMYEMSFSHAIVQSDNLQRHMDDVHAGATGYCGPVVEVNPPIQDKNMVESKKEVAPFAPAPENRWCVWVQGNGDFVDVRNEDKCAPGYNIDNGSVTVGLDYRVLHNLAIGVYGGFLGSSADLTNRGSLNMAQGNVGAYATWFWNGFYVDASGGGGWGSYNTHRFALAAVDPVLGLDFGPFANGSTDGSEVDAMGAIGYDFHFDMGKPGCLNIGPLVSVQYTNVDLDGFREHGSLLPLIYPDQSEDSVRITAGGRMSLDIKSNNGILLRPEIRAAWLHECNDQEYPIFAHFATSVPPSPLFRVDGPSIGQDGALLGAGMTVQFNPMFSIFAFYDGVLGRTNYDVNSASGGFRISF